MTMVLPSGSSTMVESPCPISRNRTVVLVGSAAMVVAAAADVLCLLALSLRFEAHSCISDAMATTKTNVSVTSARI